MNKNLLFAKLIPAFLPTIDVLSSPAGEKANSSRLQNATNHERYTHEG